MSSVSKFKFVSPGIFVNEIDNSQFPNLPEAMGPVIIGRTERGPALTPTKVTSFEEFVNVFGPPIAVEPATDVWRHGNRQGPTYASYAAQAWLASGEAPVTVVRLLGTEHTDKTSGGKAGWDTDNTPNAALASNGGAYGLFVVDSASVDKGLTGSLAAVWYVNEGAILLSGAIRVSAGQTASLGTLISSVGDNKMFNAAIYNTSGTKTYETSFNFSRTSDKYIRKVFNTNPQNVNSTISSTTTTYWLGQTYERFLADTVASSSSGTLFGMIVPLLSGTINVSDNRGAYIESKTGWIISQDLTTAHGSFDAEDQQKLFRLVARNAGTEMCRKFKVSISNIRTAQVSDDIDPFGTFDVEIRSASDTDNAPQIIERFTGCNLNPNSLDYVARRIGDKYQTWSQTEKRFRYYGNFDNVSKYVRVDMNTDVGEGKVSSKCLPFGNFGPVRFRRFSYISGATAFGPFGQDVFTTQDGQTMVSVANASSVYGGTAESTSFVNVGTPGGVANLTDFTGSFLFPSLPLRVSASDGGLSDPTNAYFGVQNTQTKTSTSRDEDYIDYVRALGASPGGDIDNFTADNTTGTEYSHVFTMDDLVLTGSTYTLAYYSSGSRVGGTSWTKVSGAQNLLETKGYDRFTLPIFGGFNGLDIKEVEPFRNTKLDGGASVSNYAYHTIERAIDSVSDPEEFECNLMTVPNLQNETLTAKLIKTCEDRADALAIIDLNGDYVLSSEGTSAETSRAPNVDTTITNLRARGLNSSYGCCFFPYVRIRDNINGAILDCPPSVVALGTFANSQAASKLWFAPAGFNRGGLSQGAAGIPVVGVKQRLNSKDRDKLYAANINPIATFPSEGIVVFGQKTLQVTPSALDRINVRRLLIYVKKEISRIAATILFDQNVEVTWARFRSKADTFLGSVKAGLGLTEYKVILDSTTTTPDLIDRNAVYAKIFLKPSRAIEFIAIDFVITRTGAAFED